MKRKPSAASAPRLLRAADPDRAPSHLTLGLLMSLQAFDWAVRLGSFSAAAAALHLTPSAVSHRIRHLESVLGERLFTRAHRTVRPTREGLALVAITGNAFSELARATAAADPDGLKAPLRLAVAPAFASAWLVPRLGGFLESNPGIELAIETVNRTVDFDTELFDAAICPGDGNWSDLKATHIADIFSVPVCAPEMAKRLVLEEPADLARAVQIQVSSYPLAWMLWFTEAGIAPIEPRQVLRVDSYALALQAAAEGAGVALGLEPLIQERLRSGALVTPIDVRHANGSYWLVHRRNDHGRPGLRAFRRWLAESTATR